MNIDIERLKHDREYWDSVAPEGATHAQYVACHPEAEFYNADTGMTWRGTKGQWQPRVCENESIYTKIPRPAKQWSGPRDWIPLAGEECEYRPIPMINKWQRCKFIGIIGAEAFVLTAYDVVDRMKASVPGRFRPLKSEKDRVVEAATEFFTDRGFCPNRHDLGAAYEAGLLKMPEGE